MTPASRSPRPPVSKAARDAARAQREQNVVESKRSASVCAACGKPIAEGAPVALVYLDLRSHAVVHRDCVEPGSLYWPSGSIDMTTEPFETVECQGCGRPMTVGLARDSKPHHRACSLRCEARVRRREAAASKMWAGVCANCGVVFEGKRSDARYCSPGCRLKMHRTLGKGNSLPLGYAPPRALVQAANRRR